MKATEWKTGTYDEELVKNSRKSSESPRLQQSFLLPEA